MNKKINTAISLILILAMAAGCSNNAAVTSQSEQTTTEVVETTMAPETPEETEASVQDPETTEATEATEATAATTEATTTTTAPVPTDPVIEFTGKSKDVIKLKEDSYYEGDKFFIFAQKGTKLRGDIPKKISKIMKDLEKFFGMSYDKTEYVHEDNWRTEIFGGSFRGLNEDMGKVSIIILKDKEDGSIENAWGNEVQLFDSNFDPKKKTEDTVYHELAHILRLRQGEFMGSAFEEGVALFAQDKLSRKYKFADWSIIQYINCFGYNIPYSDKNLRKNPEKEFVKTSNEPRNGDQDDYQVGIRFITFLTSKYGNDIIRKISETSRKYKFTPDSRGTDMETAVKVIKEATSDDVFIKFKKWLPGGWKNYCKGYLKYMKRFGL